MGALVFCVCPLATVHRQSSEEDGVTCWALTPSDDVSMCVRIKASVGSSFQRLRQWSSESCSTASGGLTVMYSICGRAGVLVCLCVCYMLMTTNLKGEERILRLRSEMGICWDG